MTALAANLLLLALVCPRLHGAETWGEKLGWSPDARVLILHADDIGMCYEANQAAQTYLLAGHISSAALMVPCPWYNEMADWYRNHPDFDLGLHLALTSEWKWYRWGPVAAKQTVPGLLDEDGYLHRSVEGVARSASAAEVETELRAQIEKAIRSGPRPTHIDTHMGTLFAKASFTEVYLKLAEEYRIPAMVIELTPDKIALFREQGYPMDQKMIN